MNLYEIANKENIIGKIIYRKNIPEWMYKVTIYGLIDPRDQEQYTIDLGDLKADDWEIKDGF